MPNLKAEFSGEKHTKGTVSAARTANPDSANSQFYICFDDAPWLDRQYSVWGQVVEGMDKVDKIKKGGEHNNGAISGAPDKILKARIENRSPEDYRAMPKSPLSISLDLALAGKGAPSKAAFKASLEKGGPALDWLREQYKSEALELLQIPSRTDDLEAAEKLARKIGKGMKTIAVLGIGGSSLGGQALTVLSLVSDKRPFVEFHDNPDPLTWQRTLKRPLNLPAPISSPSRNRAARRETLAQVLTAEAALKKAGIANIGKHFTIITEPHQSALADFAASVGASVLDHPTGVGGRYSVAHGGGHAAGRADGPGCVGARRGAQTVLEETLAAKTPQSSPVAKGAALHYALEQEGRLTTTILGPYADKLAIFGGWWRQLWAESLGRSARAPRRSRCWVRWTSTASCSFSATGRATPFSP